MSRFYKKFFSVFICTVVLLAVVSCQKQERENEIAKQEAQIDTYIGNQTSDSVVFNNGVYRVIKRFGSGAEAEQGDSVYFYYAIYKFNSGKGQLYATNQDSIAKANGFPVKSAVEKGLLNSKSFVPGIFYGMTGMRSGEYGNLVFSSKRGYGNEVVYNIEKNAPLFVEVWLEKVIKN